MHQVFLKNLALAQVANGGDILFLEACQTRSVRLQLMLPLEEPEFIERSILPATNGEQWRERYFALKASLQNAPLIMPDELGPLPICLVVRRHWHRTEPKAC